MLCVEPVSAREVERKRCSHDRTISPFHMRVLLLIVYLADSLEALTVSSLHAEILLDGPCSWEGFSPSRT